VIPQLAASSDHRIGLPAASDEPSVRTSDGRRLRADRPLISRSGDLDGEAPVAERGDDQPAPRVRGIRLGMTWRTERHQPIEIEVRAPLGALDDVHSGLEVLCSPRSDPGRGDESQQVACGNHLGGRGGASGTRWG